MNLGQKIDHAKPAINSILRHDDEGIVLLRAAAGEIKRHVDVELAAAEGRAAKKAEAEK